MTRTVFITGGIGSGKSALCRILMDMGIPVYDSDSRTKALYDTDPDLVNALEKALAMPLRNKDGRLDRRLLSSVIFSDPSKLELLESIVHPTVLDDFLKWRDAQSEGDPQPPFVVMESAIVLQKPLFKGVADHVVLVDAPLETRIDRACRRDSRSREEIQQRILSQSVSFEGADTVIMNDSTLSHLEELARGLVDTLS